MLKDFWTVLQEKLIILGDYFLELIQLFCNTFH